MSSWQGLQKAFPEKKTFLFKSYLFTFGCWYGKSDHTGKRYVCEK